ncbi:ATP-binding protein [Paenibacillus soyae]|uniref:ATP-binding protein n=1 Tax=Paenibacillus soyae TaxID=2969249 RepID=A0A9X2MLI9_9BACL|nr:ATP-binding protein [Paenibacillus soyae]MCR2802435.1 ATP-binding protein [Paenibacillus soyae]
MSDDPQFTIARAIRLYNRIDELPRLNEGLEALGADLGWPGRSVMNLMLACEELVVNIVHYAYPEGGEHVIEVDVRATSDSVEISVSDGGVPFNPLETDNDPLSLLDMDLEERPIGGLGIFFVQKIMDDVQYEHAGGMNRVRMIKRF